MIESRRTLLTGLVGFVACAPAIVRAASLMPVKSFKPLTTAFTVWVEGSADGLNWTTLGGVNDSYAFHTMMVYGNVFIRTRIIDAPAGEVRSFPMGVLNIDLGPRSGLGSGLGVAATGTP